jgi:hypothetical protein
MDFHLTGGSAPRDIGNRLREVAAAGRNEASASAGRPLWDLQQAYANWVRRAETELANYFESVTEIELRGFRHYRILDLTELSLRAQELIGDELRFQAELLERLA